MEGSWVEDGGRQKAWIKTEWGDLQEKMAENTKKKIKSQPEDELS